MGDPDENELTPEENLELGLAARHTAREETIKLLDGRKMLDQLVNRLEEGLDAEETKFFTHKGKVISEKKVVAHMVRLTAIRILEDIYGLGERKIEIDVSTDLPDMDPGMKEIFKEGAALIVRKITAIK